MKILFDTNLILDVLFDRKPFSEAASQLLSLEPISKRLKSVSSAKAGIDYIRPDP